MPEHRTILISVMQFESQLRSGDLGLTAIVKTARELGVDGVEFRDVYWRDKVREIGQVRDTLVEHGLIGTYATFATLFDATQNRAELRQAVDDAVALGSRQVRIFPGQVPPAENRAAWNAATEIVDYASSHGIVVALENFAKTPGCRLVDVRTVLDQIASQSLGTNLDIGNYAANGQDVLEAIHVLGDRVVSTHLKDVSASTDGPVSTPLGEGSLPLAQILTAFDRLRRPVVHCFEFGGGNDPVDRVRRSLDVFRGG